MENSNNTKVYKYSAIIPTLYKSKRIFKLVEDLLNSEHVGEVILIDNTESLEPRIDSHPKLKYICEGTNTGVNPAWNKGVRLAENDLLIIANDDVNFDPNILQLLTPEVVEESGIIGMDRYNWDGYNDIPFTYEGAPFLRQWKSGGILSGWACLMMLKKSMWIDIPEDLIIYFGDNWIKDINPVKKSILCGFRCETEMSSTSDLNEFNAIKRQDAINWVPHYLRNKEGKTKLI